MIDERVAERLKTFLWDVACSIEGNASGNWAPKFSPEPNRREGDWANCLKQSDSFVLHNNDTFGGIAVVKDALREGGFTITTPRYASKGSIKVNLRDAEVSELLERFDRATKALPAARVDFLLGNEMERQIFTALRQVIQKESLPKDAPSYCPQPWVFMLDKAKMDSLQRAIGVELRRKFKTGGKGNLAAYDDPKFPEAGNTARLFADLCEKQREKLNRDYPLYPFPEFDEQMVRRLCEYVNESVPKEQERLKAVRQGSRSR